MIDESSVFYDLLRNVKLKHKFQGLCGNKLFCVFVRLTFLLRMLHHHHYYCKCKISKAQLPVAV